MVEIMPLDALGRRIIIMGTTNAGKSTLCQALARKLAVPAIYLDQLRHLPETDWVQRPDAEFAALHDAALDEPGWVMDGNYTRLLPQRLARATGLILIDDHHLWRYGRYVRRTLLEPQRAGNLEGARDSLKWSMVHWIWHTRNSFPRYHAMLSSSGLPLVTARSLTQVKQLHSAWALD